MKHELKIEFKENQTLENVIKTSYFEDNNGVLVGKKASIPINQEDPLYIAFKGLNNNIVRILNEEIIDGSMRCIVSEDNPSEINLFPINNYCIIQDKKYSFY